MRLEGQVARKPRSRPRAISSSSTATLGIVRGKKIAITIIDERAHSAITISSPMPRIATLTRLRRQTSVVANRSQGSPASRRRATS